MASIQKTAKGYRAQVKTLGVRDSQVFPTRREAVEWGARRELQIKEGKTKHPGELHTLLEALRRYAEEVSPLNAVSAGRPSAWPRLKSPAIDYRWICPSSTSRHSTLQTFEMFAGRNSKTHRCCES